MVATDVEPVFRTKRQRLLRDVLAALAVCAVFWFLFLGDAPGPRGGVLLVGGGGAGGLYVGARAGGVRPVPDRWIWDRLVDAALVLAIVGAFRFAPIETAWAGIGAAVGSLIVRLLLFATGEWRPGDTP